MLATLAPQQLKSQPLPSEPYQAPTARPARVCFLIDELAPAGTETQLLALIRHLDRSRVQPFLCLLRGQNESSRRLEPTNCPVLRLEIGSLCSTQAMWQAWRLVRFLRRERIDVLQSYFPDSNYFGIPLAFLAGVPHRLRVRNNLGHWLTPVHRLMNRILRPFLTGTLTNCQAARQALLEAEGGRPDSVLVFENGVDLDRLLELPINLPQPWDARRIGIVANLRPIKGLDVLVDATAQLHRKHPEIQVEIAGEGEQRSQLEKAIRERGLQNSIHLRGSIQDITGFLSRLDIAVLCSRAEGMSNALLEYMAAGRAIVATRVGGNPELVEDGKQGLLIPPGEPGALARAIGHLIENPDLAMQLGKGARQRVWERFSRQAMIRRFEQHYTTLVHGRISGETR